MSNRTFWRRAFVGSLVVTLMIAPLLDACRRSRRRRQRGRESAPVNAEAANWRSLFNGQSLSGWKVAQFGGEGEVKVEDGYVRMGMGDTLTGITYGNDDLPRSNYEIRLEAQRIDGIDFFCGLTFPVKDDYCSFIVGGWAGAVVGLSSIDGLDASENATTKFINFETGRWYRMRIRVTDSRIQCWIDDKQIVDQDIVGKKISIRDEVDLSKPLGFSAWQTVAGLRNIEIRTLD